MLHLTNDKPNRNAVDLMILRSALDNLPLLRDDLNISGSLYVSGELEFFAKSYSLPVHKETVPFKNGTATYLLAKIGSVEIVEPIEWTEKE